MARIASGGITLYDITDGTSPFSEALPYNFGTDISPDSNGEAFRSTVTLLFFNRDSNGRDNRAAFSALQADDTIMIGTNSFIVDSIDTSDDDHIQIDLTEDPGTLAGAMNIRLPVALSGTDGVIGTNGTNGLPGVATIIQYEDHLSTGNPDQSDEYRFLNSSGNTATSWDDIASVAFQANADLNAIAGDVVNNESHLRYQVDNNNWIFFLITNTSLVASDTVRTFTLTEVNRQGGPTIPGLDTLVGFGWDIGRRGEEGQSAYNVSLSLSPDRITQDSAGDYTATTIQLTAIFSLGTTIRQIRDPLDTISVSTAGVATPSTGNVVNQSITLDTGLQYDVAYSNNNRTITVSLETTAGQVVARDSVSITESITFATDIQSDNFSSGSDGWQLERDTGDAEFNDVTIRGNSTVDSVTIGGDAAQNWAVSEANTNLGGVVGNNVVTNALLRDVTIVDNATGTYDIYNAELSAFALVSSTVATVKTDLTPVDLTFNITYQFLNSSNTILGTQSDSVTSTFADATFAHLSALNSSTISYSFDTSNLNDVIVPVNTEIVRILLSYNIPTTSNFTLSFVFSTAYEAFTLVSKPTNVSLFASSNDPDRFALEVRGGLGASIPSELIFDGDAGISLDAPAALRDAPDNAIFQLEVQWDSTATGVETRSLQVLFSLKGTSAPDLPTGTSISTRRQGIMPLFAGDSEYIGYLRILYNFENTVRQIFIDRTVPNWVNTGYSSTVSNIRITKVWRKLS